MSRASDELLSHLHGLVGSRIQELLDSDDPKDVIMGIDRALKFLKDNNITATLESSPEMRSIHDSLPSREQLEELMRRTI